MVSTESSIEGTVGAPTAVETLARRAARERDPKAALQALTALRKRLAELEALRFSAAVQAGLSWAEIGRALGISRQAAHNRYGRGVDPEHSRSSGPRRIVVTAEARNAVQLAREEGRRLGAAAIGTEHILLGILGCERSYATWALRALGGRLEDARAAAESTVTSCQAEPIGSGPSDRAWRGLSPHAHRVLERSLQEALDRGEGHIGVEDLLVAVLRDEQGGAAQTLRRMNIDPREVLSRLAAL